MADIVHHFPIAAPIDKVFRAVPSPGGLDQWWTRSSTGQPAEGADYETTRPGCGFQHRGWPSANDHYYTSCYCWAMYLRILKRFVEHGETVPYESRLDV